MESLLIQNGRSACPHKYIFKDDSLFCPEASCLLDFDHFLIYSLQKEGYNLIVFSNMKNGLFCRDQQSWENLAKLFLFDKEQHANKAGKNEEHTVRNQGIGLNRNKSKIKQDNGAQGMDTSILIKSEKEQILEEIESLKNSRMQVITDLIPKYNMIFFPKLEEINSAIVFDSEILLKSFGNLNPYFADMLKEWGKSNSSYGKVFWVFQTLQNERAQKELYQARHVQERLIYLDNLSEQLIPTQHGNSSEDEDESDTQGMQSGNAERGDNIIEIIGPGKGEIRNYINYLRIIGKISINIFDLDEIVDYLYYAMKIYATKKKIGDYRLKDLNAKIEYMLRKPSKKNNDGSLDFNCETINQLFNYKDEESGKALLANMIGMNAIKDVISQIKDDNANVLAKDIKYVSRFEREELLDDDIGNHFALRGNPGTGKTTVAKIIGKTLKELGVLSSGHVVVCNASSLLSGHVGGSALKAAKRIKEAMGGVLLVDEVKALVDYDSGELHPFLGEINSVLLDAMTAYSDLSIIVAGYPEYVDRFIRSDQGYTRRFPSDHNITLPDYTPEELTLIFLQNIKKMTPKGYVNGQEHLCASEELKNKLPLVFDAWYKDVSGKIIVEKNGRRRALKEYWGNAGLAIQLAEIMRKSLPYSKKELTVDQLPESFKLNGFSFNLRAYLGKEARNSMEINGTSNRETAQYVLPTLNYFSQISNPIEDYGTNEILEEAVVAIQGGNGEGTGFLISPEGVVVTCAHVVKGQTNLVARVRMRARARNKYFDKIYKCNMIAMDEEKDLTLLQLVDNVGNGSPINDLIYLKMMDFKKSELIQDTIKKQGQITMMGYPGGVSRFDAISTFTGRVASIQDEKNGQIGKVLLDIQGKSGNSGSPCINEFGEVVGYFRGSDLIKGGEITEEVNYMLPIKYVWELIKKVNEKTL